MQTVTEFQLKIYSDGVVEVAKDTVYLKSNGKELTRERHRQVLEPGRIDEAIELLDDHHLKIVEAVWTNEVVELYHLKQQEKEEQQATEESGF